MKNTVKYPFYIRLSCTLLSIISIGYIFFIGESIIIPVLLAFLFAVLLLPIASFLNSKMRLPNAIAVSITVLFFVLSIMAILAFISYQISDIASDFEGIRKNINIFVSDIQGYIRTNFKVSLWEQKKYLEDVTENSVKKGKESIGTTLLSVTDTIMNLALIPIYIFLILLYRKHFVQFLIQLIRVEFHNTLSVILIQIKEAIQNYIIGLIIEMIVVSILTSIGLYFIGVQYYILLGIITGILNLIPYIGILIAGVLTFLASLTGTPDLSIIVGVIGVNVIVQLIDNNILVPLIINTKVQINAIVSIIGIIIGGAVAGVSGMFLAIPILAILKIIFDQIESLKPWGYLMSDNLPKNVVWEQQQTETEVSSEPIIANENETIDENNAE